MAAVRGHWKALAALALACCAPAAGAQEQPGGIATSDGFYRCPTPGRVTYSQVRCPGGKLVGPRGSRESSRWQPVPQDRAVVARRARLSAEDRQECATLDRSMRQEERLLKAKGEAVTLDDEMPLVRMKKKFRETKC